MNTIVKAAGWTVGFVLYWAALAAILLLPIYLLEHNGTPWWMDAIYAGFAWTTVEAIQLIRKKKQ